MNHAVELPVPRDWQVFEDFCRDLFAAEWGDPNAQKHGRPGQKQHGVDVFGIRNGCWQGVQCKRRGLFPEKRLTMEELRSEVAAACEFDRELETLIVATTAPPDTKLQTLANQLTDEGDFRVVVCGWIELCSRLQNHPRISERWAQRLLGVGEPERSHSGSGISAVPPRPPHYRPRAGALAELEARLLGRGTSHQGITGTGKAGVQGMGGIGKTVLASELARARRVVDAFPDGVFWVTVGQEPRLEALQRELATATGAADPLITSVGQGERVLEDCFRDKRVLVVLDDVWQPEHAVAFDVIRPPGRLLITTRNVEVLTQLGAEELRLNLLSMAESLELLADWAGSEVAQLPPEARKVARKCGRLPLALAMIGAMIRRRPTSWPDALERLKRVDHDQLKRTFPKYPYPDLLRALAASVEALEPSDRECYLELAVFPEDAAIPEAAIETLWSLSNLDELDTRELIDRLIDRSLFLRDDEGLLRLHDLQGDYLRKAAAEEQQAEDLRWLHERLILAYERRCPDGFASGPNDEYFFQQLPAHLLEAGRFDDLQRLLLDFRWLRAKLTVTNIAAVIDDFRPFETNPDLKLLRDALRISAHVLARDKEQLATQLSARLMARNPPELQDLLRQAGEAQRASWALIPRTPSLEQAGGALWRVLAGHESFVSSMAVLDAGRVVSASYDKTLRVWDVATGETLQTLKGHADGVLSVAVLDARRVVSAASDGTLLVWDVEAGETLQTLEGHESFVSSVAVLDAGRVVSAASDKTLRVWDVETGETLQALGGHTNWVSSVAVLDAG